MSGGESRPNIFTISPGAPFLDSLARAIVDGVLPASRLAPSQLELTDYTVYLPNRRACRAMRGAFLKASPGGATLLPKLRPLGIEDEDAGLSTAGDEAFADSGDVPAIRALERRMALTSLILGWTRKMAAAQGPGALSEPLFYNPSPAGAADLASELMRLLDQAQEEQVDLRQLAHLAPQPFAHHWELTADFLKIVTVAWPQYLRAAKLADPIARRNLMMAREAQRLAANPSGPPVIIAGSTGSIPATAALMRAVLGSCNGAVVLPGLDLGMDDASWSALPARPEHPQYGLRHLLDSLDLQRHDVRDLAASQPLAHSRQRLLREALRPPETVSEWPAFAANTPREDVLEALRAVSLIAAPTPQDEAGAIALIIREAAETPGKTAALVTPDRQLARRVCAQLKTWNIDIDDSAGRRLGATPAGAFLDLILAAMQPAAAPAILALMQHPLARLGLPAGEARRRGEVLDLALLREPGRKVSLSNIKVAMKRARGVQYGPQHPAMRRLTPDDWGMAEDLCARLADAFAPLIQLEKGKPSMLCAYAHAHLETAKRLSAAEGEPEFAAWSGAECEAALRFMTRLGDDAIQSPKIEAREYPALYRSLMRGETVRGDQPSGRISIWGPLEARLQQPDVIILGGLNEGVWPQAAEPGPWLNRTMLAALGFQPPERRNGQAAHDFAQAFGCPEVFVTRAEKADGAPTVPNRWLMRLQALLGGLDIANALAPDKPWVEWARQRQEPLLRQPATQPKPRPPVAARPRVLSVTAVETFIANPYAIYARYILSLEPLPELGGDFTAREKGQIIHAALSSFSEQYPGELPPDAAPRLAEIADSMMAKLGEDEGARAFWRPRFQRFAEWFAETEAARREGVARIAAEIRGQATLATPEGVFTLTARADRIDMGDDETLRIYDYKSGSMPAQGEMAEGRAPQLALEAWIASEGGFSGIPAASVSKLAHISAKGGELPGEERAVTGDAPSLLAAKAKAGLFALIADFDREQTPYTAMRRAAFDKSYRFDPYEHLARMAEWSAADIEGES
ncbi:MAG: double-strand break repair protein AddB [Chitinophagales bacterium]|nr:double-strand break repair protein AddB [Hyphomicrobiales bacterium]